MKVLSDLDNPSSSADALGCLVPGDFRQSDVFTHIPKSIIRIAQAGHAIIAGRRRGQGDVFFPGQRRR